MATKSKRAAGKKKVKKVIPVGVARIRSTFNNTIIAFTDPQGNVLTWASGGTVGFKGTKKGTPYAAQLAAKEVIRRSKDMGMHTISVHVNGPGPGREAALRAVLAAGFKVLVIRDVTPIPHNGCRPPKRRRV